MPGPRGFEYAARGDGSVEIRHHGRPATILRGDRAARFLREVTAGDAQEVMARWTGNYRRGNERTARNHPRNSGRR
ncbi:hypothetical protein SRB5_04000 [Streptomyces sp. RB5]|uniref:Uncharacterized protein n=1 Tax=Streptomyces smaragdinus TaxID=2585196 RepID=A0A7K0CA75_9ACTN|nr:hypothetical protein [Streptomyces smaragdinus]MQY10293.1 hypothetical protein [Streptomyces smaragdinus]